MTVEERDELLEASLPVNPRDPGSRRYVVRGPDGLEMYDIKLTRLDGDEPEFHGHPATFVPGKLLSQFRDRGVLQQHEYKELVKSFGALDENREYLHACLRDRSGGPVLGAALFP